MLGRYRLGEQLGAGGMGVVYEASDENGTRFAIKMLRSDRSTEPASVCRFKHEAIAGRIVEHPHLVRILEQDEIEGVPFLVMEYIDGELLGLQLRKHGALSLRRAIAITVQVLDALQSLHDAGIVHGDVKSDNILLRQLAGRDSITLIDLGLAHVDGMPLRADRATISGTPDYMAPELAWGDSPTARTDLYAVGCLLYELVTGSTPFAGGAAQDILRRQLRDPVVPPSLRCPDRLLPPALERLILRALQKAPQHRIATARAFSDALAISARSFDDEPALTHPIGTDAPTLDGLDAHDREDQPTVPLDKHHAA